ncbi:MAG: tRNA (adenosine(37)-N6)-threonylcarbamoyltransferase complex dimerization subunit type 1 TsaB [Alteromonadaceae bacterium]|nr:tRNA (adenosine(37)-N6)-threonylcarbamoyltransferase complex dimerization subunit type 1 TsaB [Alteromonadaceae bacterium]
MNLLALDASTEACSVALTFNGELHTRYELCPQSHSQLLLPMVDQVLKAANCQLTQLDGLVFGQGPGSFTGVRIGIGVAQGLAFAANLPLVGVSTLQAMAQLAYEKQGQTQVISAIDARMSEVYNCFYQLDSNNIMQAVLPETVLAPELLADHLAGSFIEKNIATAYGVGTGWQAYESKLSSLKSNQGEPDILFPHAEVMLTIAKTKFIKGETVTAEQAQPVYVRDTVSWKKLPGR